MMMIDLLWVTPQGTCNVLLCFLINCWSSVVASVVLTQLCNLHCFFFFFLKILVWSAGGVHFFEILNRYSVCVIST